MVKLNRNSSLAIVNRSFWPGGSVLGEALLQFAEASARTQTVYIITQSVSSLALALARKGRGDGVSAMDCRSRSDSSTGLLMRSVDALTFACWTLFSLVKSRPKKVYVSTDPPVVVPFVVFLYCKLFRAIYCYHLQDIHPEAANIVVELNPTVYRLLRFLDGVVMRNAACLITLSSEMQECIYKRSGTLAPIYLVDNPALPVAYEPGEKRLGDFVFSGNAGRLQRIPLLLSAIKAYLHQGGAQTFTFVGKGFYSNQIEELASTSDAVNYHGLVSAKKAAEITCQHQWALLPIDDEVTRYAFPSKSGSYALSGCRILAICGKNTSVAQWVIKNRLGKVCTPEVDALVQVFWDIELAGYGEHGNSFTSQEDSTLSLDKFQIYYYVQRLSQLMGKLEKGKVTGETG